MGSHLNMSVLFLSIHFDLFSNVFLWRWGSTWVARATLPRSLARVVVSKNSPMTLTTVFKDSQHRFMGGLNVLLFLFFISLSQLVHIFASQTEHFPPIKALFELVTSVTLSIFQQGRTWYYCKMHPGGRSLNVFVAFPFTRSKSSKQSNNKTYRNCILPILCKSRFLTILMSLHFES